MNKSLTNKSWIIVLIPSLLWTALGVIICFSTNAKWYNYAAALFPGTIIAITCLIAIKFRLVGGLVLLFEGIYIMHLIINNLNLFQVAIMSALLGIPVASAGIMLIYSYIVRHIISP